MKDHFSQIDPMTRAEVNRAIEVVRFSHVANRRRCPLGLVYAYPIQGGQVGCQVLSQDGMPIAEGIF